MHSQSALSTEYVRVAIDAGTDPTADTVQMAFPLAGSQPVTGDWKAATWRSSTSTDPDTYYVRCLVGPGPGGLITLNNGLYDVYVKVNDNPETVVRNTGALAIL